MSDLTRPEAIRAAFDQDLEAESRTAPAPQKFQIIQGRQVEVPQTELYRSPDGLFFEVPRKLQCGTVVTDSGLWLSPEEFADCERYV